MASLSQDQKIRLMHNRGHSVREIASILDMSKSRVHRRLKSLGVSSSTTTTTEENERTDNHIDTIKGTSEINRGGYRYILDNSWIDSKHVMIERLVLETKLSVEHGIPRDISNEYWISGDCYLREDLYESIQRFNRSPCPHTSGSMECSSTTTTTETDNR
jgi:hypothetical protein